MGYVATGPGARVPGCPPADDGTLDVGIGLDPEVLGRGLGTRAAKLAITALELAGHLRLRACVLASDARSLRLAGGLGFVRDGAFVDPDGRTFEVLVRDLSA